MPVAYSSDGSVNSLRETEKAFSSVEKLVSPSVVFIKVEGKKTVQPTIPIFPFDDDFFKHFFNSPFPEYPYNKEPPQQKFRSVSQGSGFIFDIKDGLLFDKTYLMTNNHVVEGADKIKVTFKDGYEYEATITGRDPQSDIAILEIKSDKRAALKLGDSSKLAVGEWVVAIGNPFGFSHTLTVGVVSATGRTGVGINDYEDFIQTDAAINPGNSGGPLVNLDGEVVGINTAIFSRSGGYMGIGFAIPINMAKEIAYQLIDKGSVTRGYLGVVIQALTPGLADAFGLKQDQGIIVAQVTKDSPAARSGLKQGDVIIEFAGKPVSDIGSFRNRVSLTLPGQKESMVVIRNAKKYNLTVDIGTQNYEESLAQGESESTDQLGLTVQTLTPAIARKYNAKVGEGVIVTQVKPNSIAARVGISAGAIVLQVNHKPVNTSVKFNTELNKARKKDKRVLLLLRFDNEQRYVLLKW